MTDDAKRVTCNGIFEHPSVYHVGWRYIMSNHHKMYSNSFAIGTFWYLLSIMYYTEIYVLVGQSHIRCEIKVGRKIEILR